MEIAVIGGSEFVVGFQLAGVKKVFEVHDKLTETIEKIKQDDSIGILIIDPETMSKLDEYTREDLEMSVKPVVVVLSTESSQEGLRKMIRKSIGVDLWK